MLATLVLAGLQLSLMLVVFGTGLNASPSEARYLLSRPKRLLKTLFSMNVVMPLASAVLRQVRPFALAVG